MQRQNLIFLLLFLITLLFIFNLFSTNDLNKALHLHDSGETKRSLEHFQALCEKKNAQACYYIALIYKAKDIKKSKDFFLKACDLKYSSACYYLAQYYAKKDFNLYINLHKKACHLKDYESCYILGNIYLKHQDKDNFYKYFKKACDNKFAKACYKLGNLYLSKKIKIKRVKNKFIFRVERMYDNIVKPKYNIHCVKALNYYQKSCKYRYAQGCFALATLYKNGHGAKRDLQRSYVLYKRACNWGYEQACKELKKTY